MLYITIPYPPKPKKNNQIMLKDRNLILPCKSFQEYRKFAIGTKTRPGWLLLKYGNINITEPVILTVDYYLPNYRLPDIDNLDAALSDLLQESGIIENDNQIWSKNSQISGIDRKNPRTELNLEVKKPQWWRDK